uniref:Phosphodiesterase n=1 Tax=Pyramimonas obovata TaxID=1411642 RepID=A0A7S0QT34_9CHLO|mmetsp:Transcript_13504/g.28739  ORF Transcript_13504/g.28739 Transcript_13504/m.28739 type:complete len:588 (+) Transcript_13504:180-1943(+)
MIQLPTVVACAAAYFFGSNVRKRRAITRNRKESLIARLTRAIRPGNGPVSRNVSRKSLTSERRDIIERSVMSDIGPTPPIVDTLYEEDTVLPPTHNIFSVIRKLERLQAGLKQLSPQYSQEVTEILKTLNGEADDARDDMSPRYASYYGYDYRAQRFSGKDVNESMTQRSVTDTSTFELLRSFSTPLAMQISASVRETANDPEELVTTAGYVPRVPPINGRMISKTCSVRKNGSVYLKEPSAALKRELEKIEDWEHFDIFLVAEMCGGHALVTVAMTLFDKYEMLDKLDIPRDKMIGFLDAVETAYFQEGNPYHNSTHASDVLQCVAVMLFQWELSKYLTNEEIFACMLGAVIHDVGHPGWTNEFQVNNKHERAMIYNDLSVNENHHLSLAFKIAQDPACDIFQNMKLPEYKSLRQLLVQMVMGTDMSNHFESTQKFAEQLTREQSVWDWEGPARISLLKVILHCADISNPGKPVPMAGKWSQLLVDEFYLQGDEERKGALPVTPICDRAIYMMPRSQMGFITFIVQPTFNMLADVAPKIRECMLPLLETTRQHWAKEVQLLDAQETEQGPSRLAPIEEPCRTESSA